MAAEHEVGGSGAEEKGTRNKEKLIKIGVISDTHLSRPTKELEALVTGPFKDAEMILHAGDMTELRVLDAFSGKAGLWPGCKGVARKKHRREKKFLRRPRRVSAE